MATKAPVTWKKGTFQIATRSGKEEVKGYVSSSGLGVHKDGKYFKITQIRSGLGVLQETETLAEAKTRVERVSHIGVNWHKEIKPTRELRDKVRNAELGRKPQRAAKPLDYYSLKAHYRKNNAIVARESARGYAGQQEKRKEIKRDVQGRRHLAYTIDVHNDTKNRRIK